jgi:hypothetical protein
MTTPSKPYVVTGEQWKKSAIALEGEVTKLEAELRDTKRALELAAAYTDVDSFFFINEARKESGQ